MTTVRRSAWLIVCGCLAWAGPASADPVVDWNAITLQAVIAAGPVARPGPSGVLDIAIVHIAVHDAVQAIEHRFKPYHTQIPGATGSRVAAVAKAAHDVLVARFPLQTASLDATYHAYLASNGLLETDPGVLVGQQAAAGILALRAHDGSFPANPEIFTGSTAAGDWRPTLNYQPGPTPVSSGPMAAPWLGAVDPFTKKFPEQFRAAPQPPLTSNEYTRAYNEVKGLGARFETARTKVTRTAEQTQLGYFYADNLVALWHRALRGIALSQSLNIGDSARLFALASMASADAIMTSWDNKRFNHFWRPITAVQEGDNDGNPQTAGDPEWQPLINTPPYPDYTSGANNLAGSMTRILRRFFRTDKMTFVVTSNFPLANPNTRTYTRFSHVADDMVEVRIYEGIHFRFADAVGRRQGTLVANQAFRRFLRPLHDHDDDDDDDGDDGGGDRGRDRRE